ncbi:MAG: M48 family metallopeptidase [Bacteroidetes bacterium]|nr:M48 family metallopeptidase [Bacteroidota bacterium]MBU1717617.1 M48 family metallopeptidase [Bacteroidota bacterium]
MSAEIVLLFLLAIPVFGFVISVLLEWLNTTGWADELPAEVTGIYSAEKYQLAKKYETEKFRFGIITSSISVLLLLVILYLGGFGILHQAISQYTENQIIQALVFFGIIGLAADITSTPFSYYATFVIEEKYGFNKSTPRIFFTDKLKGYLVAAIIGTILMSAIIFIYSKTQQDFWWIAWIVVSGFSVFLSMFWSQLIVPLFNKQKPLEEGPLRDAIFNYASENGFPLTNIFVIDGSKRSSKANAYFTGLGRKKRIVLYDTLINDHSIGEIVAILAHEVGHWKKKHTSITMILSMAQSGAMLFLLSLIIDNQMIANAVGADVPSFHVNVLVFGILYGPLSSILGIGMNVFSRKCEYQADCWAVTTYQGELLGSALTKLSVNHLNNLQPHPLYVFFHYSHPPLLQRLRAIGKSAAD